MDLKILRLELLSRAPGAFGALAQQVFDGVQPFNFWLSSRLTQRAPKSIGKVPRRFGWPQAIGAQRGAVPGGMESAGT
jgi:hypothetical protein